MLLPLLMNNLLSTGAPPIPEPEPAPVTVATPQSVVGVEEITIGRGVPCLIKTVRAFRMDTMLGLRPVEDLECWLGVEPKLEIGYTLIARGKDGSATRYIVHQVEDRPSPHAPRFQVARLRVDESSL